MWTATDKTSFELCWVLYSRTAQCSNCHIRDEAGNWKWQERNRGGRGMHWTFASEALVWSPEQWVRESTCGWVSTCQNSWSEDERKKKTDWHWLYEQNLPNQTYIHITKHNTQHRKEQLKPVKMITENLEIKEWRTYTNGLDTIHKAHDKTKTYNVTSQLHITQPQDSVTLYRENTRIIMSLRKGTKTPCLPWARQSISGMKVSY